MANNITQNALINMQFLLTYNVPAIVWIGKAIEMAYEKNIEEHNRKIGKL